MTINTFKSKKNDWKLKGDKEKYKFEEAADNLNWDQSENGKIKRSRQFQMARLSANWNLSSFAENVSFITNALWISHGMWHVTSVLFCYIHWLIRSIIALHCRSLEKLKCNFSSVSALHASHAVSLCPKLHNYKGWLTSKPSYDLYNKF